MKIDQRYWVIVSLKTTTTFLSMNYPENEHIVQRPKFNNPITKNETL